MRYNVKIVTYNHDFVKRKVIKVAYLKEIEVSVNGVLSVLYVTDDPETGERLQGEDKQVIIYIHEGNRGQDFSGFLFAVEDPEDLEPEYVERVYRRLRGLPWNILETPRCLIRETTEEDVEDFYQIYSHPDITRYMENLYPEIEQEKAYVREYIEKVYTFFGFGVWTVVEKCSGAVIGRAGVSYREGFKEPELGFDNEGVVGYAGNIPKNTIPVKYDDGVHGKVGTGAMPQAVSNARYMGFVLFDRVVESVFHLSVGQYLAPMRLIAFTEKPAAVLLDLEQDDSGFCHRGDIYLRIIAALPSYIQIVKNSLRRYASFEQLYDQMPLGSGAAVGRGDGPE